jgi:predicted nucleic acid-binding protein
MLKIYLDNCCYNQPFDDLTIGGNDIEASAKMFIQSLIKYKSVELYYSFESLYEINDNPHEENKKSILDFICAYAGCYVDEAHIAEISTLADGIMRTGIKKKDAVHLAYAIYSKCDCFITTDKRVLKYKTDKIQISNPVEFVEAWRNQL